MIFTQKPIICKLWLQFKLLQLLCVEGEMDAYENHEPFSFQLEASC